MMTYNQLLDDAINATKRLIEFLDSELETDAKIEYAEQMLEQRQRIFEELAPKMASRTAEDQPKINQLMSLNEQLDDVLIEMLNNIEKQVSGVKFQKTQANQINQVQKKYLNPQEQVGYFINHKK